MTEYSDEAVKLLPVYRRLLEDQVDKLETITDAGERHASEMAYYKELMRVAFLSDDLATEADFERLWPRMLDERFIEHANIVYVQTMEALSEQYDQERMEKGGTP